MLRWIDRSGIITLQATAHILTSSIVYKVTLTSIDMIKF